MPPNRGRKAWHFDADCRTKCSLTIAEYHDNHDFLDTRTTCDTIDTPLIQRRTPHRCIFTHQHGQKTSTAYYTQAGNTVDDSSHNRSVSIDTSTEYLEASVEYYACFVKQILSTRCCYSRMAEILERNSFSDTAPRCVHGVPGACGRNSIPILSSCW